MSEKEYAAFREKNKEDRVRFFYRIWTAKESFIKNTGEGLSANLQSITLTHGNDRITLHAGDALQPGYFFREYFFDPGYSVCACSRDTGEFPEARRWDQQDILEGLTIP